MVDDRDRLYHAGRAQAEMDCADRAAGPKVAEAHMRLAALHMDRLRFDDEACDGSDLSARR